MIRPLIGGRVVELRVPPLVEVRVPPVQGGGHERHVLLVGFLEGSAAQTPAHGGRRGQAEEVVRADHMRAEQGIELFLVRALVVIAVPPEPVARLGDQDFIPRLIETRRRQAAAPDRFLEALAHATKLRPRAILLGVPHPDREVRSDPGSDRDVTQRLLGLGALERLPHRHGLDAPLTRQPVVERVEERVAVLGIGFPAVLSVQDHRDQGIADPLVSSARAPVQHPGHEVLGRPARLPGHVREPDPIGELPVAEDHRERSAGGLHPVGTIERSSPAVPARLRASQGPGEHRLVRGAPGKPRPQKLRERRLIHRPLGRPRSPRRSAEALRVALPRALELQRRVFRGAKGRNRERDG